MKPQFSIVIPLYNKRGFVLQALESIKRQDFCDYEVVVVDDGSTDGGLELVLESSNPKLRVVKRGGLKPGYGGYAARNLGVRLSKGTWIAFLDADDVWMKNHLSTCAELISKYANTSILCTGFVEEKGGRSEEVSIKRTTRMSAIDVLDIYSTKDIFHTNSMVIKRSLLIDSGGFPENGIKRAGDHALWLKLLIRDSPVVFSCNITTRYRRDNSSVVANCKLLTDVHPIVVMVDELVNGRRKLPDTWGFKEKRALMRLANRKSLLWFIQLRIANIRKASIRFMAPYPQALGIFEFIKWVIASFVPSWGLLNIHNIWRSFKTRG